jgi:hypothetical protein
MAGPGNGVGRFAIHCSGVIAAALRRVHRQASAEGRGKAVTRAFGEIIRRLNIDPFQIGEPMYRLPGLRMQVRTCVVRPLAVDYAVCEDRPLVFIKGVTLLGGELQGSSR